MKRLPHTYPHQPYTSSSHGQSQLSTSSVLSQERIYAYIKMYVQRSKSLSQFCFLLHTGYRNYHIFFLMVVNRYILCFDVDIHDGNTLLYSIHTNIIVDLINKMVASVDFHYTYWFTVQGKVDKIWQLALS